MPATISLVLVAYRSSGVLPGAADSFRREAAAAGVDAEVVVVDHSEDGGEQERLGPSADVLLARPNRGYAAGINAGIAASRGTTLLVGNPDIRFAPGSLGALLDALRSGWDVVGPRFVLGELLLPPADVQTPGAEVARRVATWGRGAWRRQLGREVRRWRRAWEATAPLGQDFLSGALLAFERGACERIGPWDESYFLYFEESEWLLRARRAGLRAGLVPGARVAHLWAHAADPASHAATFARSRDRYYGACFGATGRLALSLPVGGGRLRLPALPEDPHLSEESVLWLLSPSSDGLPAAGWHGGRGAPREALARAAGERGGEIAATLLAWSRTHDRLLGAWSTGGR